MRNGRMDSGALALSLSKRQLRSHAVFCRAFAAALFNLVGLFMALSD